MTEWFGQGEQAARADDLQDRVELAVTSDPAALSAARDAVLAADIDEEDRLVLVGRCDQYLHEARLARTGEVLDAPPEGPLD